LAEGLQPWGGVIQVWAAGSPDARHGVDITATFAQGVASLRVHEAYLRGLGAGTFDPEAYLDVHFVNPVPVDCEDDNG
ncbi:MAG TPA: hypothetical protein VGA58_10860, partial [bacterium]